MAQKAPELGSACHWAHADSCNRISTQVLISAPQLGAWSLVRSSLCYWPQHQGEEFCSSMDRPRAQQRAASLRTPCKAEPSPTVRKAISRGTEAEEAQSRLSLDLHSLPVVSTVLSAFFFFFFLQSRLLTSSLTAHLGGPIPPIMSPKGRLSRGGGGSLSRA